MSERTLSDLLLNPPEGQIAWIPTKDPHGPAVPLAFSDPPHIGFLPEHGAEQAALTIERLIAEIGDLLALADPESDLEADLKEARRGWRLLLSHLRDQIALRARPNPDPAPEDTTYRSPTMEETISRLARERYGNHPDSVARYLQDCENEQADRERWWAD